LGLHTYSEPIERIMLAAQKSKVSVLLPMPGQTVDEDFEGSRWWPKGEFDLVEESPAWSSGIDRAALEKRIAARAQKSAPSSKDKPSKK